MSVTSSEFRAPASSDAATPATHLRLSDLTKIYGQGRPSVDRLSLDIGRGEFVGLLGPSGCGKTTTLRMIAGLIQPTAGRLLEDGRDIAGIPTHRRNMGFVFQSYALFPHMSVADNIAFGLKLRPVPREEERRRVAEAIRLIRLEGLEGRRPNALSGGQQQRVALARALVIEPNVLLLDEPLSNLDAKLREQMRNEIRDLQRRFGITTLFVTHDQAEALSLSDRVAIMREGRLEQFGTPLEVYDTPANPFVAGFVGRANAIPGEVEERGTERRLVSFGRPLPEPDRLPGAGAVTVMVRPHHIRVGPADERSALVGTVTRRTFVGDEVELEIRSDKASLLVTSRPGEEGAGDASVGQRVGLSWPRQRTMVFPA